MHIIMYEKLGFQNISPLCTLHTYVSKSKLLICDVDVMVNAKDFMVISVARLGTAFALQTWLMSRLWIEN